MKKLFVVFSLLMIVFLGFACNSKDPQVEGVTISSENSVRSIKVGETLQLTASVYPLEVSQEVVWNSDDKNIAEVDENGLVTAVSVGNITITASSKLDENIKGSYSIIIEEALEVEIKPASVKITLESPEPTCKQGETIELSSMVEPKEASQSVVWESSDVSIATVSKGVVTALKEGTVTITCKVKGYETISDSIELSFTKSDDPVQTKDWANMAFNTHTDYLESEDETPLKIKGVVTYVLPVSENKVTYVIQNGTEGYYVYSQDNILFPVELGKTYEVGGFKKYYRGLNELVDVEYFKEIDEKIEYTVNKLENVDTSNLTAMEPFHSSIVSTKAVFVSASVNDSKAYSFYGKIGSYETTFRVDPSYMTEEEFQAINEKIKLAVSGSEFEFVGIMTAFGYGKAIPQIQIIKASELKFAELTTSELLIAASDKVTVPTTISFNTNEIALPTSIEGFDNVVVTWSSNNELINVTTGVVTHGNEDTKVTLTATLSLNGEKHEVTYDVVVLALDNKVYEVIASLDLEDAAAPNSWGNSETKSGYAEGVVSLGTPKYNWLLRNALIAAATNDVYDGVMSIRAKSGKSAAETARIEVQNDDEYNVVEFAAAVYGNDASGIKMTVEYSLDSGETWIQTEQVVSIESKTLETYRFKLPEGVKRVAIVVVENTGNRVNIDNIKLMK